jgi:hypothetical protein
MMTCNSHYNINHQYMMTNNSNRNKNKYNNSLKNKIMITFKMINNISKKNFY